MMEEEASAMEEEPAIGTSRGRRGISHRGISHGRRGTSRRGTSHGRRGHQPQRHQPWKKGASASHGRRGHQPQRHQPWKKEASVAEAPARQEEAPAVETPSVREEAVPMDEARQSTHDEKRSEEGQYQTRVQGKTPSVVRQRSGTR